MLVPDNQVPQLPGAAATIDPASLPFATVDGPWLRALWVELPRVRSKSNFRRGTADAAERWREEQEFRAAVAQVLRIACPPDWELGDAGTAVAARPAVAAAIGAATLLDTGNISKSVLDAGEGILYLTDTQVRSEALWTERRSDNQVGWAAFAQLAPGPSWRALFDAQNALQELWLATRGEF